LNNFWVALAGMTCITFLCRYFFFSERVPFELGTKTKNLLSYTAPSVLTAMWVPIVFLGNNINNDFIVSPYLIAGLSTVILSLKIKNTLVVVGLGMGAFGFLKVML